MDQFEMGFKRGVVRSSRNDSTYPWDSRLYVNCGETATLTHAKHKTKQAAQEWASRQLIKQHLTRTA